MVCNWVSPRHFQTLLQLLLDFGAAWCPEQYGDMAGMFAVPMSWEDKMWSEKVSLVHLE